MSDLGTEWDHDFVGLHSVLHPTPDTSWSFDDHELLPITPIQPYFCAVPPYPAPTTTRIPGKADVGFPCHIPGCGETFARHFHLKGALRHPLLETALTYHYSSPTLAWQREAMPVRVAWV